MDVPFSTSFVVSKLNQLNQVDLCTIYFIISLVIRLFYKLGKFLKTNLPFNQLFLRGKRILDVKHEFIHLLFIYSFIPKEQNIRSLIVREEYNIGRNVLPIKINIPFPWRKNRNLLIQNKLIIYLCIFIDICLLSMLTLLVTG